MMWVLYVVFFVSTTKEATGLPVKTFNTFAECQETARTTASEFSFNASAITCLPIKKTDTPKVKKGKEITS